MALNENRIGWARTYIKKAGLLDAPKRGMVSITERGLEVLKKKPKKVDNNLLKQFPEFLEFQNITKKDVETSGHSDNTQAEKQTPEETIDLAYQNIRQSLAQELIDTVRRLSPTFFERLVVEFTLVVVTVNRTL